MAAASQAAAAWAAATQMANSSMGAVNGGAASKAVTANSTKLLLGKANLSDADCHAHVLQNVKIAFNEKNQAAALGIHEHGMPSWPRSSLQRDAHAPQASAQSQSEHLNAMFLANEAQSFHATSLVTSTLSPSNGAKHGGWLTIPIGNLNPEGSETSSREHQEGEEPTGLLKFLARHRVDMKTARQVAMQIEISSDDLDFNRQLPLFNQQTFGDHPRFKIWSKGMSL